MPTSPPWVTSVHEGEWVKVENVPEWISVAEKFPEHFLGVPECEGTGGKIIHPVCEKTVLVIGKNQ